MKEFTLSRDNNGNWIVTSDKLPGFISKGETAQEAIEKMKQAFRTYYPRGECKDR